VVCRAPSALSFSLSNGRRLSAQSQGQFYSHWVLGSVRSNRIFEAENVRCGQWQPSDRSNSRLPRRSDAALESIDLQRACISRDQGGWFGMAIESSASRMRNLPNRTMGVWRRSSVKGPERSGGMSVSSAIIGHWNESGLQAIGEFVSVQFTCV
jgi:hypothetical protein